MLARPWSRAAEDFMGLVNETFALGTPDDRPELLPDRYVGLGGTGLVLVRAAADRTASSLPLTVAHMEAHDGNIFVRDGRPVLIDWAEAVVTHSFVAPLLALRSATERSSYRPGSREVERLRDAYLEPFSTFRAAVEARPALRRRLSPLPGVLGRLVVPQARRRSSVGRVRRSGPRLPRDPRGDRRLHNYARRSMSVMQGSCWCGGVLFEVAEPFSILSFCHCTSCKRISGGVGTASGTVRTESIHVTQGRELLTTYQPDEGKAKTFCSVCGSNVFGGDWPDAEQSSVRLSAIDSGLEQKPERHILVRSVAPWETLPDDGLPRFEVLES
jgi:hypothetical protein